ncbi:hypothetical protein BpHYR1_032643 [Brachionus plicatilis]|uniref:Uncharacterized protein n=1 Tax=Brachionus plicatilis TaxID=10195 RepID=A0A3M7Q2E6_BRAPC|nr:hypothetical protein BpHYR1_032643 [Brachionus plicatilis]
MNMQYYPFCGSRGITKHLNKIAFSISLLNSFIQNMPGRPVCILEPVSNGIILIISLCVDNLT